MTEVARAAGVSAPTVRRHVGSRAELHALLIAENPALANQESDTRSRILTAALRTFASRGYAYATIDEIAAEAGMTKGAVYWHFASKMELFKEIIGAHREQQAAQLPAVLDRVRTVKDPEKAMSALVDGTLEYLQGSTEYVWLVFEFLTSSRDPDVREVLAESAKGVNAAIIAKITELQTAGYFRQDVDPIAITIHWGALINGLAVMHLARPEELAIFRPQVARDFGRLLATGLGPVQPSAKSGKPRKAPSNPPKK